ncbi:MAG: antirepressor regulating drug resistance protein [Akkermansiaceae bacterium]|nr:antirepressor regulating drug resistance protein [Akkermansiaceae bacterium]
MTAVFQTICEALPVVTVLLALPALWRNPRLSAARVHVLLLTCALLALAAPLSLKVLPKWRILPAMPGTSTAVIPASPSPAVQGRKAALLSRSHPAPLPALPAARPAPESYRPWFRGIAMVWLAGTLLGLVALTRQAYARRRLMAGSRAPDGNGAETADRLRRWLGIRREVQVRVHPDYESPVTWGVLRPVILLPGDSRHWPESQRRIVLTHELGHIQRHDALSGWILQALLIVYWFHPLAWRLARRAVTYRELACDDLVIRAGLDPDQYATCLGAALLRAQAPAALPATMAAFAQPHPALQRMRNILDAGRERSALGLDGLVRASAPATLTAVALSSLGFKISSEIQPVTARWIAPAHSEPAFSVWKEVVAPVIAQITAPDTPRLQAPAIVQDPIPTEPIAEAPVFPAPVAKTAYPPFIAGSPLPSAQEAYPEAPPAVPATPAAPRRLSPLRQVAAWNSLRKVPSKNPATGDSPGTVISGPAPAAGGGKAPASPNSSPLLVSQTPPPPATEPAVGITPRDPVSYPVKTTEPAGAAGELTQQEATAAYSVTGVSSTEAAMIPSSGDLFLIDSPLGGHLALTYLAASGSSTAGVRISPDDVSWFSAPSLLVEVCRTPLGDGVDEITVALRDPVDYSPFHFLRAPAATKSKE